MIERRRLEELVLARLSVSTKSAPSRSDLERTLAPFVANRLTSQQWRAELERAVTALRDAGELEPSKLLLSAAGRRRLAAALGLQDVPATKNWTEFKQRHLQRLVASREQPEAHDPGLAIVASELGLPIEAARSPAQLGNAWLAKFLGIPAGSLSVKKLRAVLLAREFKLSERVLEEKLLGQLAVKFTGARSGRRADVLQALASRWLDSAQPAQPAASEPPPRAEAPGTAVLGKVRAALRAPSAKHFGDNKVFISSVWQTLRGDPDVQPLGEAGFKRLLVEAHQRGDLKLSRADLISAMDPADVAASEIQHLNATYHFIQTPGDQP